MSTSETFPPNIPIMILSQDLCFARRPHTSARRQLRWKNTCCTKSTMISSGSTTRRPVKWARRTPTRPWRPDFPREIVLVLRSISTIHTSRARDWRAKSGSTAKRELLKVQRTSWPRLTRTRTTLYPDKQLSNRSSQCTPEHFLWQKTSRLINKSKIYMDSNLRKFSSNWVCRAKPGLPILFLGIFDESLRFLLKTRPFPLDFYSVSQKITKIKKWSTLQRWYRNGVQIFFRFAVHAQPEF